MDWFFISALATKLVAFVLAIFVGWLVLRILDHLSGHAFKQVIGRINEGRLSSALYYSARLVAVAIIGAAFLG